MLCEFSLSNYTLLTPRKHHVSQCSDRVNTHGGKLRVEVATKPEVQFPLVGGIHIRRFLEVPSRPPLVYDYIAFSYFIPQHHCGAWIKGINVGWRGTSLVQIAFARSIVSEDDSLETLQGPTRGPLTSPSNELISSRCWGLWLRCYGFLSCEYHLVLLLFQNICVSVYFDLAFRFLCFLYCQF